jgi:hypothetical protein
MAFWLSHVAVGKTLLLTDVIGQARFHNDTVTSQKGMYDEWHDSIQQNSQLLISFCLNHTFLPQDFLKDIAYYHVQWNLVTWLPLSINIGNLVAAKNLLKRYKSILKEGIENEYESLLDFYNQRVAEYYSQIKSCDESLINFLIAQSVHDITILSDIFQETIECGGDIESIVILLEFLAWNQNLQSAKTLVKYLHNKIKNEDIKMELSNTLEELNLLEI